MNDFQNHPLLELRRAEVREELLGALSTLDRELPLRPAALVGGEESAGDGATSTDPCDPDREVARLAWAGVDAAERALELALAGAGA
jgi:RHH-type proline utilization regulon transcriptional repressor/proline dehydrogenase/delta 1-pyrroline-5-carboxylate dehydrogenase